MFLSAAWPISRLGGEFLPPLDEGDLLYMPSALPGLSAQKASELLQQTNRQIRSVPEVARVYGKAGRAETATDPAPLEMFETIIQFKPRDQWRPGMTPEKLVEELDRAVQVPGLANIWVPPIRNRIDMLATGIKSPIGVKIASAKLADIDRVAQQVERIARTVPGVSSALAERLTGGRYVDIDIDRAAAARYGLNVADVQSVVASLIGGENIGETVEGLARYPINVRYPREWRDTPEKLAALPILTPGGSQITLGMVAAVRLSEGPPMLKSENARLSGWVYVDVRGRDLASTVADLQQAVAAGVKLEPGMSIAYSGQFEFMQRANARLKAVVPATLAIIFVLLYLTFRRSDEALLIMAHPAVRADRRRVVPLRDGLPPVDRDRRRLHRAGRRRRRIRRHHAAVSEERLDGATGCRTGRRGGPARRDPRRRGAARAAESHDRGSDRRGPAADHDRQRHRQRGDEPHRRPDDRRHGERAAAVAVRRPGGLLADAPPRRGRRQGR